jgi:hypothetical protein
LYCFAGAACFFVRSFTDSLFDYTFGLGCGYGHTTGTRNCIKDTGQIQSSGSWGNLSFLELSNNCLDPAAQFRFCDNGAMLNLKRQGCLAAFNKNGSGYDLDMFYLYVDSVSLDTAACAQKPNESIYRDITQTPEGGLSVYYKGHSSSFQTWCAEYRYSYQLHENDGIEFYIGLNTRCDRTDQRFIFGKFLMLNIFLMSENFVTITLSIKKTIKKCLKLIQYCLTRKIIVFFDFPNLVLTKHSLLYSMNGRVI